jgi:hypothetical protein
MIHAVASTPEPVLTALTIPASEVRDGDQLADEPGQWPIVWTVERAPGDRVVFGLVNASGHTWASYYEPTAAVVVRRYLSPPVAAHHEREAKALTPHPQRKGNPASGAGHTAEVDEAATMHVERVTPEHIAWCVRRSLQHPALGWWVITRRREGRLTLVLIRFDLTSEALLLELPTLARTWHARPVGLDGISTLRDMRNALPYTHAGGRP